jgi:hypothetical protein
MQNLIPFNASAAPVCGKLRDKPIFNRQPIELAKVIHVSRHDCQLVLSSYGCNFSIRKRFGLTAFR